MTIEELRSLDLELAKEGGRDIYLFIPESIWNSQMIEWIEEEEEVPKEMKIFKNLRKTESFYIDLPCHRVHVWKQ